MNTNHTILISCLTANALAYSASSFAGAPFVTDDPDPVAIHDWEVNYAISKTWANNATATALPSVDVNYGYSENLQLHAQTKYALQTQADQSESNIDNTEIGIKYRFIHQEDDDTEWMVGIYPMLQLPTGDKALGEASGRTQAFLPIWAQLNSHQWTFYGGTGYRINNYTAGKNSWFVGATALYAVNESLKIGGELFRESATVQGEPYSSGFNIGGIYNMAKDYSLLFSAGRALNNASETNQFSTFLALQVAY